MSIIFGRPWMAQPQALAGPDYSNPLVRGATLLAHPPRGIVKLDARPGAADWISNSNLTTNAVGLAVAGDGLSKYARTLTPPLGVTIESGQPFTVAAVFTIDDTTTDGAVFGHGSSVDAIPTIFLRVNNGGAGRVIAFIRDGSGNAANMDSGVTLTPGQVCKAVVVQSGASSRTLTVNGITVSDSTSIGQLSTQSNGCVSALYRDVVGAFFNGAVNLVYTALRAWTTAEIAAFTANPWQLFAPLPRRIWAPDFGPPPPGEVLYSQRSSAENELIALGAPLGPYSWIKPRSWF